MALTARWLPSLVLAAAVAGFPGAVRAEVAEPMDREDATANPLKSRLTEIVAKLRAEKKLVGLGAMIMVAGKPAAVAVDGERQQGSGVALQPGDRWHLGSVTKSMTATMIGRLVEKNVIEWETTIGECFEGSDIHADFRGVTLGQLLTHTGGTPPNFSIITQFMRPPLGPKRVKARKAAVVGVLKSKPIGQPGRAFRYSNVGYTVAAAMAEAKTGKSWEDLIRREVFLPLGLRQAGFGPPKDEAKKAAQPRGHQQLGLFKRVVGPDEDNTPIMAPAGGVHMTLAELCAFGNDHLRGEQGQGKLLKPETYKRLHTPRLRDYAFGWVAPQRNKWTDGPILWHNGSNTMWYAMLAVLPEQNAVIAVTANDGDLRGGESAAFQIVKAFCEQESARPVNGNGVPK